MCVGTLRKKADVPIYSFAKHNREPRTSSIYSPHVLILEGIFALHDKRILDMMDVKVFIPHRKTPIETAPKENFRVLTPSRYSPKLTGISVYPVVVRAQSSSNSNHSNA
jgi:hypothetical protein